MNTRIVTQFGCLALLGLAQLAVLPGCAGDPPTTLNIRHDPSKPGDGNDDPTDDPENQPGYGSAPGNTFDHEGTLGKDDAPRDPIEIAKQREEEGPPEIRTRMHSCQKMQIATLRNMLTDLGVDLAATAADGDPETAGQLLSEGGTALGGANYEARVGEQLVWTAAGAAKQFDIFVQAAPEIIANISTAPLCQVNGSGPQMFDSDNKCNPDAITCIIGRPATEEHIGICNSIVGAASDVDKGKAIAVATLLAAAHSCE